jgi:hypothetical protein
LGQAAGSGAVLDLDLAQPVLAPSAEVLVPVRCAPSGPKMVARTSSAACHAAYLKARPSVRRRFNHAVLETVYVEDREIAPAEFSGVFAPLFLRRVRVSPSK